MEKNAGRKWSSFEEMYSDLRNKDHYKDAAQKSTIEDILDVVAGVENAITSKDFFDCTCRLSSLFDSLSPDDIKKIYRETNVYVLALNAVFRNDAFIDTFIDISKRNEKISVLKNNKSDFEKLILLNTAISMAFFGISIGHNLISATSIEFLRKNITDLLKNIIRNPQAENLNFISACNFLEKISWDNGLHHNNHFDATFPVRLKDNYLFTNLKTSRSIAGVTFTSLVIRPTIENQFKKIISNSTDEKFSITYALNSIFDIAVDLDESINHYYRHAPKDISSFFDTFIKSNEKNLIYCFKIFCTGFHFQGKDKKFYEIILEKVNASPSLKFALDKYAKENFSAYNSEVKEVDDQWTNKIFLISLKTASALEQVKSAQDLRWAVNVAVHELHQWLTEIHEVLNKYYIEDDWEKIREFVVKENEIVEWKSSFFLPMRESVDSDLDAKISKDLFSKLLKVLVGMLNTDGGVLLVGKVENPEDVQRVEAKENIINKNGITFFDINYELKKYGKTLDHLRLEVLDNLKRITDTSPDLFNGLIELDPITLRDDNRSISIIKITIRKSEKLLYNVKKEGDFVWISLTRRAHGRNVDVDIREYI